MNSYKRLVFLLLVSILRQSVIQSSKLAGEICSVFTLKEGDRDGVDMISALSSCFMDVIIDM